MSGDPQTLLDVLRKATGYLESRGSDSPRLDAELLMAHALGLGRLDLYLQFERRLSDPDLQPYRDLVARRARGEPVAYLVGHKEFMNLDFEVTADVLVPNPDTEVLVLRAIEWCRARGGPAQVGDVGTGSGCIAVALAHYVPEAVVCASDDSSAALTVAERNIRRHDLEGRVRLCRGDLLDPMPDGLDLVCANLPYVAAEVSLPAEVRAQPGHALLAPEGGTALVRRLLAEAPEKLSEGGCVLAEIDPAQRDAFEAELTAYVGHRLHKDLGGHVRVLEAWR
jgi:release factor glutamine methyltransferase